QSCILDWFTPMGRKTPGNASLNRRNISGILASQPNAELRERGVRNWLRSSSTFTRKFRRNPHCTQRLRKTTIVGAVYDRPRCQIGKTGAVHRPPLPLPLRTCFGRGSPAWRDGTSRRAHTNLERSWFASGAILELPCTCAYFHEPGDLDLLGVSSSSHCRDSCCPTRQYPILHRPGLPQRQLAQLEHRRICRRPCDCLQSRDRCGPPWICLSIPADRQRA